MRKIFNLSVGEFLTIAAIVVGLLVVLGVAGLLSEDKMDNAVRICVVSQEQYDSGPFYFGERYRAGSLNSVIDSLCAIRDSIPEQYRDCASCEIDSISGYEGSHYAEITVSYQRQMTDDEIRAAEKRERERKKDIEDRERRILADLQAKYASDQP